MLGSISGDTGPDISTCSYLGGKSAKSSVLAKIVKTCVCMYVGLWPRRTLLHTLPPISVPTHLACLPAYAWLEHTDPEAGKLVLGEQEWPSLVTITDS